MSVGSFIKENSKLLGVITVCSTWITSRLITAKHYEHVNEQRLRMVQLREAINEDVAELTNYNQSEPEVKE